MSTGFVSYCHLQQRNRDDQFALVLKFWMSGLKLSALSQIKLMTAITTFDDLNYPEKTETYYIINVLYIFSACWKTINSSALMLLLCRCAQFAIYDGMVVV